MSPTTLYFCNAAGWVDYVPDAYVYLHWTGAPMSSAELRALYVHARNLLERHQFTAVLADHRVMPAALTEADRSWLLTEWLPQAVAQTSYTRCAVLRTTDPAHRLHTDEVVAVLRRHLSVELCDTLEEADEWLRAAPRQKES